MKLENIYNKTGINMIQQNLTSQMDQLNYGATIWQRSNKELIPNKSVNGKVVEKQRIPSWKAFEYFIAQN